MVGGLGALGRLVDKVLVLLKRLMGLLKLN
jgi:hypothetical protein